MNSESIIRAYIEIETKTFVRSDKAKKLDALVGRLHAGGFNPSAAEVETMTGRLLEQGIPVRYPLFLHVFFPALKAGVDEGRLDAILTLALLFEHNGNFQKLAHDSRYTFWELLKKGLLIEPANRGLLLLYKKRQETYLAYTLHELPDGVLYGADGASREECDLLLQELEEFERACATLGVDEAALTDRCRIYYAAYKDYLSDHRRYEGFKDYLDRHTIPVR